MAQVGRATWSMESNDTLHINQASGNPKCNSPWLAPWLQMQETLLAPSRAPPLIRLA